MTAADFTPPFRIQQQAAATGTGHPIKNKQDEAATETATETDGIAQPNSGAQVTFGRAPERWLCSSARDFSVLTFERVSDAFRLSLTDSAHTALVVHRLTTHVSRPEQFCFGRDALRVLRGENAGGASEFSEALSCELLARCFGAQLERTEMEIDYEWGRCSKRTDYTCRMYGQSVAVSVTRAMKFQGSFLLSDALRLLRKKLLGVRLSNRDVVEAHRWSKQVLHVLTAQRYVVELLREAYVLLLLQAPALVGDTLVLVTHTLEAPFLYFNFCADQTSMQFVTEEDETAAAATTESASQARVLSDVFTTPTTTANARVLPAAAAASMVSAAYKMANKKTPFWYGYPTLEEARAHKALPEPIRELGAKGCKKSAKPDCKGVLQRLWSLQPLGRVAARQPLARGRNRVACRSRVGCRKARHALRSFPRSWQPAPASHPSFDRLSLNGLAFDCVDECQASASPQLQLLVDDSLLLLTIQQGVSQLEHDSENDDEASEPDSFGLALLFDGN